MGIKRPVDTSFWTDDKVDDFSPEDKYFMLYLMTGPLTTQLGIYGISVKQFAFHLGYSLDTVRVLLDRFENKYGIIIYSQETSEIAIKNYLRHSIIKGGFPVRDCLIKEMAKVKNKDLIAKVFAHVKSYEDLNKTVAEMIAEYEEKNGVLSYSNSSKNNNEKDNENENDNENDDTSPNRRRIVDVSFVPSCSEIISYLNEKAGTRYKPTTAKTKSAIKARLSEGFTIDDFKTVIDKKCAEWIGDEKMEKYLRPETLFGTKFEGYLNAKTTGRNGNNGQTARDSSKTRIGNYI